MSRYRRANTPGAPYFFTVVTYRRQPILCDFPLRAALRLAIEEVRSRRPFAVDAWVAALSLRQVTGTVRVAYHTDEGY